MNEKLEPLLQIMEIDELNGLIENCTEMGEILISIFSEEMTLGDLDSLFFTLCLGIRNGDTDDKKALFARARAYMDLVEEWEE